MPVTNYTLAQLITDVYYRRFGRNASEATADERATIIRFAETNAREAWNSYHHFFSLTTAAADVSASNTVTIPSDCESVLSVTDASTGIPVRTTQRGSSVLTVLDRGYTSTTASLTLEYRTVEPTYTTADETTAIHSKLYTYLQFACVADLWGADHQAGKYDFWMKRAVKALSLAMDIQERQRGLKKRASVRTYRRQR